MVISNFQHLKNNYIYNLVLYNSIFSKDLIICYCKIKYRVGIKNKNITIIMWKKEEFLPIYLLVIYTYNIKVLFMINKNNNKYLEYCLSLILQGFFSTV